MAALLSLAACDGGPPPTLSPLRWIAPEDNAHHYWPIDLVGKEQPEFLIHQPLITAPGVVRTNSIRDGRLVSETTFSFDMRGKLGNACMLKRTANSVGRIQSAPLIVVYDNADSASLGAYDLFTGAKIWELDSEDRQPTSWCSLGDTNEDGFDDLGVVLSLKSGVESQRWEHSFWTVSGADGTKAMILKLPTVNGDGATSASRIDGSPLVALGIPGAGEEQGTILGVNVRTGVVRYRITAESSWPDGSVLRASGGVGTRLWSLGLEHGGGPIMLAAGHRSLMSLDAHGSMRGVVRGAPGTVLPLWDIDGDGVDEFIALVYGSVYGSAPTSGGASPAGPSIRLFSGTTCRLISIIAPAMSMSGGVVGDVDGGGLPDVYIGVKEGGFILHGEELAQLGGL